MKEIEALSCLAIETGEYGGSIWVGVDGRRIAAIPQYVPTSEAMAHAKGVRFGLTRENDSYIQFYTT